MDALKGNTELGEKILRQGFNPKTCFEEAIRFFGSDVVNYLAIDGTEFDEERLDMLIFFAGAFGYSGSVRFSEDEGGGAVVSDVPFAESESVSLSSAIPVSDEYSSHVAGELTEGGLDVDPLRVPQALMHFAEYFLAYQKIRKDPRIRILLMDRSVSGDIAHISWKMREYIKTNKHCLLNYNTSFGRISNLDLELGRMLISNQELGVPPPRSQFLKFAAMQMLIDDGEQTIDALISGLGANSERTAKLSSDLLRTSPTRSVRSLHHHHLHSN